MTSRAFHDALYHEGNMPIEMVRLALNGQKVDRNYQPSWELHGPSPDVPAWNRLSDSIVRHCLEGTGPRPFDVAYRADESHVGQSLREVPQLLAVLRIDLF